MAERILTGIKPTGQLTLGNYIAVLKNLKQQMDRGECFIFIADLHALTLPIDPEVLRQNSIDLAAFYLAAGLDPKRSALFYKAVFLLIQNLMQLCKTIFIWVNFRA